MSDVATNTPKASPQTQALAKLFARGGTWKGHMIVGWNPNASSYQALLVDNLGMMVPLNCELTDTRFVATSERPLPLMGKLTSARFTWDFSDIDQIKFTNEHQVDGGPWQLWEEEIVTPS